MTASCHYINTAMKDIKGNFLKGLASYSISGCDLGVGPRPYFSALTNEQTDRLMHNISLYNSCS